jgi:nucleoside-diphosphate-sugar epimerase
MVHTSTSETYGTARYTDRRQHPPTAIAYSASKLGADLGRAVPPLATPVATIRPFNTYGPRQSARAVIPTIAAQLVAGRHKVALGDLRPVRDLLS